MKIHIKRRLMHLLKLLAESVLPIFFWVFLIFGFDAPYMAILTIITAVIHELGHMAAIAVLSVDTQIPSGHISGFRIRRKGLLPYFAEAVILAMGPLANLAVFLITLPFGMAMQGYIQIFGLINLVTAISNLLPVEGYDGYGILMQILMARDRPTGIRVLEGFSFFFSVCATFFSLYVIDKFGSGYWIFGVFFAIMTSKLIKYGKYNVF